MVLYGYWQGEQIGIYRGIGLCIALAGIIVLLLPDTHAPDWGYALIMVISGLAWAGYSIAGRNMTQPIGSTLANFTLAVPMVLLANVLLAQDRYIDMQGWVLAILSGGVTSSGAYVLWYAILKHIDRVTASTVQLSVPCLAIIGGSLFVNETVTGRVIFIEFYGFIWNFISHLYKTSKSQKCISELKRVLSREPFLCKMQIISQLFSASIEAIAASTPSIESAAFFDTC